MVEAGILIRISQLVATEDPLCTSDFVALLLSLSNVPTATSFFSPATDILLFLDKVLNSDHSPRDTKLACLVTLHHLSTLLDHNTSMVSSGTIHTLIRLSTQKDTSEQALATLGNLVVSVAGKQAVEVDPGVPNSFIEVLAWEDKPKCQELALYILMILAHGSSCQRGKMAKSGIVQVLLEVVLLGSPLAQKRAMKILQWFRDERQRKIGPHSGPQTGRLHIGLQMDVTKEIKEGRMAIKRMVRQSLYKNMELIMRRADQANSPGTSKIKSLIVSSSSKSLTY